MRKEFHHQFKSQINNFFGSQSTFLFSKGRVGLYATLKALGLKHGERILIPGYTCLVVPTAPMDLGVHPIYIDIDPSTYNLNPALLSNIDCSSIQAVIAQHTYGIPCDMQPIMHWAKERGVPVIEDCCLAFGSTYQDQLCGTFGVSAYFSGQWNKPFSTGLGGMLVLNDKKLAERIGQIVDIELKQPSNLYRFFVWLQILLHENLVTPSTFQFIMHLYRFASKFGLAIGSSNQKEFQGRIGKNYFMAMTSSQAKKGVIEMSTIQNNLQHRRLIAEYYENELPNIGFNTITVSYDASPCYVCYPVRVKNKWELLHTAKQKQIPIGSWFESPLHPAETDLSVLHYTIGSCPEAERAANETITLPTHQKITPPIAAQILNFLHENAVPAF